MAAIFKCQISEAKGEIGSSLGGGGGGRKFSQALIRDLNLREKRAVIHFEASVLLAARLAAISTILVDAPKSET